MFSVLEVVDSLVAPTFLKMLEHLYTTLHESSSRHWWLNFNQRAHQCVVLQNPNFYLIFFPDFRHFRDTTPGAARDAVSLRCQPLDASLSSRWPVHAFPVDEFEIPAVEQVKLIAN